MSARAPSPFTPRAALGLVLFGALSFVLLLWMIGTGIGDSGPGASGGHAMGKGLNGYAALSAYLKKRGYDVSAVQSRAALGRSGLLILTPLHEASAEELQEVVNNRRQAGPTIVVVPKWRAIALPRKTIKVKEGFVQLVGTDMPDWKGFYVEIRLNGGALKTGPRPGGWEASGLTGELPNPEKVISGDGKYVIPLAMGQGTGQILAGYMSDGGDYPKLRRQTVRYDEGELEEDPVIQYPVVFVFDADLFNNYGMSREPNARLAEQIIRASLDDGDKSVAFDLTLVGYGRSPSLLTLAFTPPYLAATLCLLLTAAVALWRAYRRFGPALLAGQAIAFGKRALVSNSAGLIHRARRLHLLGAPYADAARERLAKSLALPARLDHQSADAAIDRALAARSPGSAPFSAVAANLRAARKPSDLLRAARQLHALERTLTR